MTVFFFFRLVEVQWAVLPDFPAVELHQVVDERHWAVWVRGNFARLDRCHFIHHFRVHPSCFLRRRHSQKALLVFRGLRLHPNVSISSFFVKSVKKPKQGVFGDPDPDGLRTKMWDEPAPKVTSLFNVIFSEVASLESPMSVRRFGKIDYELNSEKKQRIFWVLASFGFLKLEHSMVLWAGGLCQNWRD